MDEGTQTRDGTLKEETAFQKSSREMKEAFQYTASETEAAIKTGVEGTKQRWGPQRDEAQASLESNSKKMGNAIFDLASKADSAIKSGAKAVSDKVGSKKNKNDAPTGNSGNNTSGNASDDIKQ